MKNASFVHEQSHLSARFTLYGKRRRASPAIAALFFIALPAPVGAKPQVGPTSSTSVSISLSVAPQFGLRSTGAAAKAASPHLGICIATNGERSALPMLLVRARAGGESHETGAKAEPLAWCAATGEAGPADRAGNAAARGLLIVQPE